MLLPGGAILQRSTRFMRDLHLRNGDLLTLATAQQLSRVALLSFGAMPGQSAYSDQWAPMAVVGLPSQIGNQARLRKRKSSAPRAARCSSDPEAGYVPKTAKLHLTPSLLHGTTQQIPTDATDPIPHNPTAGLLTIVVSEDDSWPALLGRMEAALGVSCSEHSVVSSSKQ